VVRVNEFIVRTNKPELLEKVSRIQYKSDILNFVFIETDLSIEEVLKLDGVVSVELNDIYGTLCG
jgi:hypothetical protein